VARAGSGGEIWLVLSLNLWAVKDNLYMPSYPPERKQAIINKMAAPNPPSIASLSQSEGISEATLYNWRQQARLNGQLLPDTDAGPDGWSAQDRFNAVLETAALPEAEVAEYCRRKGLYPEQIERWKQACLTGCDSRPAVTQQDAERLRKDDKKQIAKLEKELRRKEKALAEAAAIIVLQKNLAPFLVGEDA